MWTFDELNLETIIATSPLREHNGNREVESKNYFNKNLKKMYIEVLKATFAMKFSKYHFSNSCYIKHVHHACSG